MVKTSAISDSAKRLLKVACLAQGQDQCTRAYDVCSDMEESQENEGSEAVVMTAVAGIG